MAKGGFPGFGGGNMANLMKQAQKMQESIQKVQEDLKQKTVEATVGGGSITVIATGEKKIQQITIKPEVVDPEDVEMLQDLIIAAVNEALRKADELSNSELSRISGGLGGLPGLF